LLIAQSAQAADATGEQQKTSSFPIQRIDHVSLHPDGSLIGQVVDRQGIPQADLVVEFLVEGKPIARTTTQRDGRFVIRNLPVGLHEIRFGGSVATVQLWLPSAAPPVARTVALLVRDENIVLGQNGRRCKCGSNHCKCPLGGRCGSPLLFRGAVVAGIAAGVTVWAATSDPPGS
jgi:hypothetical protein